MGAINQKEVTPLLFWVLISRPLINGMSVFVCVWVQGRLQKDFNWSVAPKWAISKLVAKKKNVIYRTVSVLFPHQLIINAKECGFYLV